MSKLTNFQIRRQIESLAATLIVDEIQGVGGSSSSRRRRQKLAAYKEELAAREAAGENPGACEIQGDNRGRQ